VVLLRSSLVLSAWLACVSWLACVPLVSPALAQEDAGPRRVGVILLPRGAASPEMTDSLTELLIAAVASRGTTEIVGKEEFQAALGRDDAGALECIESDACVGRMGRELRLDELVAGTLHIFPDAPDRFRFELYRLDVESGSARGRVARELDGGFSALLGALTSSVDELYVERVEPSALVVEAIPSSAELALDDEPLVRSSDGVFRQGFLPPGDHVLLGRAPGHRALSRALTLEPGTTLMLRLELEPQPVHVEIRAVTLGPASGGPPSPGVAIGVGLSSQSGAPSELGMRQSRAFYDARDLEATLANVLFVVGGVALVAGAVSLIFDLTASEEAGVLARLARGEVASW